MNNLKLLGAAAVFLTALSGSALAEGQGGGAAVGGSGGGAAGGGAAMSGPSVGGAAVGGGRSGGGGFAINSGGSRGQYGGAVGGPCARRV